MELGKQIAFYRKAKGFTQETLAQKLTISNQAVSKWESNQCYPDISLLPQLAEIFEISLDELFGISKPVSNSNMVMTIVQNDLPWEDDRELRAVVYIGRNLVKNQRLSNKQRELCEEIKFVYEGDALNVTSAFSVHCGEVKGNVEAKDSVTCEGVGGDVHAGDGITCQDIGGNASAGDSITSGNIGGNVAAGDSISCGNINGNVSAGDTIHCGNVVGNINAGDTINCCNVEGSVDAGDTVNCCNVEGNVSAGDTVSCGDVAGDVTVEGGNVECACINGDVKADIITYIQEQS